MIKILEAESYRVCNHCTSDKNVLNINIRYKRTNSGTQIALCERCANDLMNKLYEVLKENSVDMRGEQDDSISD